jgi:hypothetical protein
MGELEKLNWKVENGKVGITLAMSLGVSSNLIRGSGGWRQPKGVNPIIMLIYESNCIKYNMGKVKSLQI